MIVRARWFALLMPVVSLILCGPMILRGWPVIVESVPIWGMMLTQMLLVLVGGAALAFGVAYAVYRRSTSR